MKGFNPVSWVRSVIERVTSRWQRGPKVEVVAGPWDLPGGAPSSVTGRYTPGRATVVHIVAHQPAWTVLPTLAHEAIGHHGLRWLLRNRWSAFMAGLHRAAFDKRERPLQRIVRRIRKNYADADGRVRLTKLELADEIAAHAVQDGTCPHTGELSFRARMKARWTSVRKKLVRGKPGKMKLGYADLIATVREAARRFTDRYRRVGVPTGWSRWQPRSPLRPPKWKRPRRG